MPVITIKIGIEKELEYLDIATKRIEHGLRA